MEKLTKETRTLMQERFGKDQIISLATAMDNVPYVRSVNAFYMDRAFYVLTYALSNKITHITTNPKVAVAGD